MFKLRQESFWNLPPKCSHLDLSFIKIFHIEQNKLSKWKSVLCERTEFLTIADKPTFV